MSINYKQNKRITDRGTIEDVRGYSRLLCKFLDLICGHGAHEKHIPEFAYTAPEEFIIGLIDGYISGDGCVEKNAITASSCSENLIDGINQLLTRLGIFSKKGVVVHDNDSRDIKANYNSIIISIRAQWAHKFKLKIKTLLNGNKNTKLINLSPSKQLHPNYKSQKDIVLDEIKEINRIEVSKYKKLYDLTIPSTLNFIIFNGLGCRDTAESGYVQRKLIKSTEDFMVNYDCTVRNAVGRIQQFIYGDSGADTVKQYAYKFHMIEMSNNEIIN
jgi:intein/homing endonuclease